MRYKAEYKHEAWTVVDSCVSPDDLSPMASCGEGDQAHRIADALNWLHELTVENSLVLGTTWDKAGIRRLIVGVSERYVWYRTGPTQTRTARERFVDWLYGAKLVSVGDPTRRMP